VGNTVGPLRIASFDPLPQEEVITLVDARMYKPLATKKFSEEMNELSFNNSGDLLFVMSSEGHSTSLMCVAHAC
jgi:hypothetical protein